ncbi:hypothetical protein EJB05_47877, partial [Eragrostis curvula]
MDKLVYPRPLGNPSSPASLFSVAGGSTTALEFASCEIPDQWLGVGADDDDLDALWGNGAAADNTDLLQMSGEPPAPAPAAKRRGRKPGSSRAGGGDGHVEAERQRRDKLNRRFCDLRAAVPKVTRMDKASLLADAAAYIAELRGRVEELEAEAKQQQQDAAGGVGAGAPPPSAAAASLGLEEKLEVRMLGPEAAALRLTSAARHGPARLMDALRQMDLPLQHACVCRAGGVTVQNAVVDVPAGPLQDEAWLRAALLHRLQGSGCLGFL